MPWIRKGLLFSTDHHSQAMISHATYPTPLLRQDALRIYFAARNANGKGSVNYIDVDPEQPSRVIRVSASPVLTSGQPGAFDDSGTQPNFILRKDGRLYLYYMGWNLGVTFAYRNCTGLAYSDDDGDTFHKPFSGPVLERAIDEPYFAISPAILREGDIWHTWYTSGTAYRKIGEKSEWDFVLRYASSRDGIHFERAEGTCMQPAYPGEVHSRAYVLKDDTTYKMWMSYRGLKDFRGGTDSYQIGYAESRDGQDWIRRDEFGGLEKSADGWDAEMTCFASVVDVGPCRYLLYNGNGFGKTGIGYAEWVD